MPESTPPADGQGQNQQTPPANQQAPLLAGKYKDQAALEQGINEGRKALNLTPFGQGVKLIGEGGVYADVSAAENEYKAIDALINSRKGNDTPKPGEVKQENLKIGGAPLPDDADVQTMLKAAGVDYNEALESLNKNGDLTPEQYDKIQKADPRLSKPYIKFIARGIKAESALQGVARERAVAEASKIVGGAEKLDQLLKAAKQFIPENEQDGFNSMLQNPSTMPATVRLLQQMHTDYIGAGGSKPLVTGSTPSGGAAPIKDFAEYKEVERLALAGDKAAQARILATPSKKLI